MLQAYKIREVCVNSLDKNSETLNLRLFHPFIDIIIVSALRVDVIKQWTREAPVHFIVTKRVWSFNFRGTRQENTDPSMNRYFCHYASKTLDT